MEHDVHGHREVWKSTGRPLGQGSFGFVTLETQVLTKAHRAVKCIPKAGTTLRYFFQELNAIAMSSIYPDSLARFFGWYEDERRYYLAMEYFELRDLGSCMETTASNVLPEEAVKAVAKQVLQALTQMHGHGITHRDLKPQNIFVASMASHTWRVKVGDFGVSKRVKHEGTKTSLRTITGTPNYMAPEVMFREEDSDDEHETPHAQSQGYTNAVDIWSLGCTLYELLTGQEPFEKRTQLRAYIQTPSNFPEATLTRVAASLNSISFVKSLLSPEPKDRPTAIAAQSLPWLVNMTVTKPSNVHKKSVTLPERESLRFSELTLAASAAVAAHGASLKSSKKSVDRQRRVTSPIKGPSAKSLVESASEEVADTVRPLRITSRNTEHSAMALPTKGVPRCYLVNIALLRGLMRVNLGVAHSQVSI